MTKGLNANIPFTPFFGSFILDTLTLGMYVESKNAIREYVQNSYDSLCSSIKDNIVLAKDAKIDIVVDTAKKSVSIRDNGSGIRKGKASETLTNIGASGKDYKTQAGFRGIGRLSGLVFCNKLVFRTKAKGEEIQTIVTFDARGIRYDLSPARAPLKSLSEILIEHVKVTEQSVDVVDQHFFEVSIEELHDPPIECTDIDEMKKYLGEVAPVPYRPEFIHASRIITAAELRGQKLEEIQIFVHDGANDVEGTQIFKHYSDSYYVQSGKIPLSDIEIIDSPTGLWWGWIGKKEKSGIYKEEHLKAIRVRVRNLQIDGIQIMGRIFGEIENAASYVRFNDWYIGEIFAHPERLIPNARRDGFEELEDWITAKHELTEKCSELGKAAYALSQKSQGNLSNLFKDADRVAKQVNSLLEGDHDIKDVSKVIAEIDKIQRKVNRATKSSDNEIAGQLRTIETRLFQYHKKALSKIKVGTFIGSPETIANAQREIVTQLIDAFNEEFDRSTYARIMKVIERVAGLVE